MGLKRTGRFVAIALLLIVVALGAVTFAIPDLRWRAGVVGLKLRGGIPEISMTQLLRWLVPGNPVYLGMMELHPTLDAGVHNLKEEDKDYIEQGGKLYQEKCSSCHAADATGAAGPNLIKFVAASTDWAFLSTAKFGRPGTAMAAQPITDDEIWRVHSYLRDKSRDWLAESSRNAPPAVKLDVPFSKLLVAEEHPEDWLIYTGDLKGYRHSRLNQITNDNVSNLRVAWAKQLRPSTKPLSSTPIVVNGVMYVTEAPEGVLALDASSGEELWRFSRPIDPSKLPLCCGAFNRGVSVMDNRVFVATLDSHLVAIDGSTGKALWDVEVAPPKEGYSMTSAPMAIDGHIVVGVAGGEYGIRGFVAAYSPTDGKELWRFWAIPGPGEPGHETWSGDSWKTGGASTWTVGSYDKERDLIYWTIGNPWPPLDTRVREGDNLYSDSIVALDRKTGKMQWYFQFTPNDGHDWDSTQQIVLTDLEWKGQTVQALLIASRNAFYYALDRRDGTLLYAKPFVKQSWATSVDEKGRPRRDPKLDPKVLPSKEGSLVWPWMHGGTNWWAPSYDPIRKLHFVPTVDAATLYFLIDSKYTAGNLIMGGTTQFSTNQSSVMAIKAIDPKTGDVRWSTRLDKDDFHHYSRIGGLVSTDGGIVVGGYEDRMSILDSDTGKELWKFRPGGLINAGAMTYSVNGVQYIGLVAGNVLYGFSLPTGESAAAKPAAAPTKSAKK